jgi:poly-gamma-glutamate capsule biosynthesis protein CapA/YwtB (metallophosphatase superfamily)
MIRNFLSLVLIFAIAFSARSQDTLKLSLIFGGDIMGHGSQISAAYEAVGKKYDYTSCFQFIKPYLESADLAIGNLEVTFAGRPYTGYPQFSSPDELGLALKASGFDILVTSNNHCVDRGRKGLERTIAMLDSFKIPHTGTFVDTVTRMNDYPLIVEKNGFRLALLNYTFSTNGLPVHKPNIVNRLDTTLIRKDIQKAKEFKPDAIIVFTHWGVEYESLPRKSDVAVTEFCFRHGAKLVIGAHPHVLQPMEWRKNKDQFVVYSLGNYVSGQRKRYTDGGALAYVELEKISYRPDSAVTHIDSAAYFLHWVYRTADVSKDYYMLPVHKVEHDSVSFIRDATSKAAFKTFAADSRLLYQKYNKNVKEAPGPLDLTKFHCNSAYIPDHADSVDMASIKKFLMTFDQSCISNHEFRSRGNEYLFLLLDKNPAKVLHVLEENIQYINVKSLLDELSAPIHQTVSVPAIIAKLESIAPASTLQTQVIESLKKSVQ